MTASRSRGGHLPTGIRTSYPPARPRTPPVPPALLRKPFLPLTWLAGLCFPFPASVCHCHQGIFVLDTPGGCGGHTLDPLTLPKRGQKAHKPGSVPQGPCCTWAWPGLPPGPAGLSPPVPAQVSPAPTGPPASPTACFPPGTLWCLLPRLPPISRRSPFHAHHTRPYSSPAPSILSPHATP